MLLNKSGQPVLNGDVVHVNGKAFTVHHADPRSGYVQILSCEDRPCFRTVYPSTIGARWDTPPRNAHVHEIMRGSLECFR